MSFKCKKIIAQRLLLMWLQSSNHVKSSATQNLLFKVSPLIETQYQLLKIIKDFFKFYMGVNFVMEKKTEEGVKKKKRLTWEWKTYCISELHFTTSSILMFWWNAKIWKGQQRQNRGSGFNIHKIISIDVYSSQNH